MVSDSTLIGVISESKDFTYGYDGKTFYVTEKSLFNYYVTTAKLSLMEAKAIFEALNWCDVTELINPTYITKQVKECRKLKLTNDSIFWYLVVAIDKYKNQ